MAKVVKKEKMVKKKMVKKKPVKIEASIDQPIECNLEILKICSEHKLLIGVLEKRITELENKKPWYKRLFN